jgi:polyisoprenoid-binding protein YceI
LLHRRSPTEIELCENQLSIVKTPQGRCNEILRTLVLAVVLAPAALAQHQTFAVNPDASEVKMKLNTTHEVVNGIFHVESGSINVDRTASDISGIVIVAAGSGKTGDDSRDKKMNKDILKVDQFATVSFASKTYTGTIAASGDSAIQVSGVFTLLGKSHDLTIPMQIQIDGSKATAKGQIRRSLCTVGPQEPELPDLGG